jgi:hypothetical protein
LEHIIGFDILKNPSIEFFREFLGDLYEERRVDSHSNEVMVICAYFHESRVCKCNFRNFTTFSNVWSRHISSNKGRNVAIAIARKRS